MTMGSDDEDDDEDVDEEESDSLKKRRNHIILGKYVNTVIKYMKNPY